MNYIKSILSISIQNIRKWQTNYRVWIIAVILLIIIHSFSEDIALISNYLGIKSSQWVYPFLYTQFYMKLLFTLPVIMLFCDAPFIDENQIFVLIRAGRTKWTLGQILYIIMSSAIYFMFIIVATLIFGQQHTEWSPEWGKVIHTIAETNIASSLECHFLYIPKMVVDYFTPLQAIFFTFLLSWLSGILIGLIVYAINLISKTKSVGVIIGSAIVVLSCFVENESANFLHFSPISWNTLNLIDVGGKTNYPTFQYCITVYSISILTLIAAIIAISKKKAIQSEKSI